MRILPALLVLFALGCSAEWQDLDPIRHESGSSYGGTVTEIAPDSYMFESTTNPGCYGDSDSECRKAQIEHNRQPWVESTIRDYNFSLKFDPINGVPEFVIIFQDWVRIHSDDSNGNRPITTLKILNVAGSWYLSHWDNSWQWDYDPTNYDTHLVEGRERMNGWKLVQPDVEYSIRLIIGDDPGFARLFVDDVMISDAQYKTVHKQTDHIWSMGIYTSKEFVSEFDDFKLWVYGLQYRRNFY